MAGHHCSNSIIYSPVLLSFRFLLLELNCFGCFTLVLVYLCLEANGNSIPNTFSWAYRWRTVYIQPLNETMLRLWISFSRARWLAKWKSNIHLERWTCQTQRNGKTLRFATLWDGYHLICICQAQTLSSPSSSFFRWRRSIVCVHVTYSHTRFRQKAMRTQFVTTNQIFMVFIFLPHFSPLSK